MNYVNYVASVITEDPDLFMEATAAPNQNVQAIVTAMTQLTNAITTAMSDTNMDQNSKVIIGKLKTQYDALAKQSLPILQAALKTQQAPQTQPKPGQQPQGQQPPPTNTGAQQTTATQPQQQPKPQ